MSSIPLAAVILGLSLGTVFLFLCDASLSRIARKQSELEEAKKTGSHKARLQYPHIDLSRCLGCGTCVRACPES